MESQTVTLTLSRRNLLALLKKLDYVKEGGMSACTIGKYKSPDNGLEGCDHILVRAVEDEDYYIDREPGKMLDNKTGEEY